MNLKLKLAAALLTCASSAALAQSLTSDTGLYLGGSYGGFKSRGGEFDDDRDFYGIHGGWQITPYLGLEGNYVDFSRYGNDVASADVDGMGAALVGQLPLSDAFALYARAGVMWWDGDLRVLTVRESIDDRSPFYGLGVRFMVTDLVSLKAEYTRYEVDNDSAVPEFRGGDTDLDTVAVGAAFHF